MSEERTYYCLEGYPCSKEYYEEQARIMKLMQDSRETPAGRPLVVFSGTGGEITSGEDLTFENNK